jgi:hypothetical protein
MRSCMSIARNSTLCTTAREQSEAGCAIANMKVGEQSKTKRRERHWSIHCHDSNKSAVPSQAFLCVEIPLLELPGWVPKLLRSEKYTLRGSRPLSTFVPSFCPLNASSAHTLLIVLPSSKMFAVSSATLNSVTGTRGFGNQCMLWTCRITR